MVRVTGDALHSLDNHSLDSAPPKNEATSPEKSEESSSGESGAWAAATAPEQTELVKSYTAVNGCTDDMAENISKAFIEVCRAVTADGKLVAEEVWFRRQKAEGGGGV